MAATKVCRTCGEELGLDEFAPHPNGTLGRTRDCRKCRGRARQTVNVDTSPRWPTARVPLMPHLPGSAACAGADQELFYPTSRGAELDAARRVAKAVCAGCGVRTACAAWALNHEQHGVWGGLDEDDRREMRKNRTAA